MHAKQNASNIQKLYFYEASMLEYNRNVRFLGRKDLMKVTQSMLEYRILVRTSRAGIK